MACLVVSGTVSRSRCLLRESYFLGGAVHRRA